MKKIITGLALWAAYSIGHRWAWYKWEINGGRKP